MKFIPFGTAPTLLGTNPPEYEEYCGISSAVVYYILVYIQGLNVIVSFGCEIKLFNSINTTYEMMNIIRQQFQVNLNLQSLRLISDTKLLNFDVNNFS